MLTFIRSAILFLSLALCGAAFGETVTLMQGLNGYTGTTDAHLWGGQPTTNRDLHFAIRTEGTTGTCSFCDSEVIRFAIFANEGGPVPNDAVISSATLSLYQFSGPPAVIKASRLKKSWNEQQVTWNNAASGAPWTVAGANSSGTDYVTAADGQGQSPDAEALNCDGPPLDPNQCWLHIPVTGGVQAFQAAPGSNFGWKIAQVSSPIPGNYKNFNTSENPNFPNYRPKLTVTYTVDEPTCTPPTAVLNATPTSGAVPLQVTFDASGSTDGTDPITSLTLNFGDGSAPVTWANKSTTQPHTYTAEATHNASLTVTSACATSAPATRQIQAGDPGDEIFPATPAAGSLGSAVPTFHSMSLYYNPQSATTNETVWMRYRRSNESTWREGWRLWHDPRTTGNALPYAYRARGSAVYLQPNQKYYFEFGTGSSFATATWHHHVAGTTWSETFAQDGAVTTIPSQSAPYVITQGGSPSTGYKVYDGWNGSGKNVINRNGAGLTDGPSHDAMNETYLTGSGTPKWQDTSFAIVVKASYVVVRRVHARGAAAAGIIIYPNVTNVVIEDSEISDWSWRLGKTGSGTPPSNPLSGWGPWGMNEAGGIHLSGNNSRIVLQRNVIRDPHHGSTPWDFGHAIGPLGIGVMNAGQQNVFRYNEIYASGPHINQADKMHWYLDGISGTDNFGEKGVPGADSDIYGNNIRNIMDDGIEAEGGGRNVRVWGNYIDHTSKSGIGTTTVHFGPMYVFRNVINRVRSDHTTPDPETEGWDRGVGFKAYGMVSGWGGGRAYFFNNTHLQQPGSTYSPPQASHLGASAGIYGASSQGLRQVCSRNNIYHHFRTWGSSIVLGATAANNDLNYDLHSEAVQPDGTTPDDICSAPPAAPAFEQQGILAAPTYKSGHGWSAFPRLSAEPGGSASPVFGAGLGVGIGQFQLGSGSPGLDAGQPLPNFTTDIDNTALAAKSGVAAGGTPNMGAHDSASTETMKFGPSAGQ